MLSLSLHADEPRPPPEGDSDDVKSPLGGDSGGQHVMGSICYNSQSEIK